MTLPCSGLPEKSLDRRAALYSPLSFLLIPETAASVKGENAVLRKKFNRLNRQSTTGTVSYTHLDVYKRQVLAMKNTPAPEEEEQAEEGPFAKELGLLAIGAVLIAVGADLLVDNGTLIAQALRCV